MSLEASGFCVACRLPTSAPPLLSRTFARAARVSGVHQCSSESEPQFLFFSVRACVCSASSRRVRASLCAPQHRSHLHTPAVVTHIHTHTHPHTGNKSSQHWGSTHCGLGLLVDYRAYSSHHCPSTNGPHCHPDQRVCVCVCLCVPEIHTHEAIDCVLKLPGNSKVMPGLPFIVDPPICYAIYSCVSSTPCM